MGGEQDLSLWNDNATRAAIVDFVRRVTDENGPAFVPPAERVAVFDNDGTLWFEKPVYVQLLFILNRWQEMVGEDPSLREQQPWKAALEKDFSWFGNAVAKHHQGDDSDASLVAKGVMSAFAGTTLEDYTATASEFIHTQSHPLLKKPYVDCAYAPMIELTGYLRANGFTSYISTGGGRDFMRTVSEELYGIPPDQVIGSSASLEFREDGDGGDLVMQAHLDLFDYGPTKPMRIWSRVGRYPIFAAGNTDGDIAMLEFANRPARPSLRLHILHDDAGREADYTEGAGESLRLAKEYGWTVVSIKNDWKSVFRG